MNTNGREIRADELKPALPARCYGEPDFFRAEAERIFHRQWFCVGRAEQLPARGDCLHVSVAGESVLVVRGKDETLRAFYNICRHRGSRLIQGPALPDPAAPGAVNSGNAGAAIVCPYHAWSYQLDGSLRAAPFVRFDERCPKERFSLTPVALDTWGGFIFVNLSEQQEPLASALEAPARRLVRYPLGELRRGAQIVYEVRANWKAIVENYNECYHCGPVHPELCALVPAFREQGGGGLTWDDGVAHRPGAWTFTQSGTSDRAPFPGLSEREKTHHKGEAILPNLLLSVAAEHVAAFLMWPMGPDATRIACEFLFHPSEIAKPTFDPHDVTEFWDLVNRQDWKVCEGVQSGMQSRGFQGAFFAPMEDPSLDIRRYLERHLGEIAP